MESVASAIRKLSFMLSPANPKMKEWLKAVTTKDIPQMDALKIYRAFEDGADTEHSVAKVTGIDALTCRTVLDLAEKHDILNK